MLQYRGKNRWSGVGQNTINQHPISDLAPANCNPKLEAQDNLGLLPQPVSRTEKMVFS